MTEVARSAALGGIRDAALGPAWIVGFSLLGVGSLARDAGHPIGAAMLSTVAIWAAPAQLILYAGIASGGLLLAAAISVALSAIRLLPMTIAILPLLRRPGQSLLTQLGLAHLVAATAWIEGMRRLPTMPEERRVPFFVGFALTCMAISTAMTAAGFLLVGALPRPLAAAILCLTPIYFTVAMTGAARHRGDWAAIGLGLGLLPVAQLLIGRDYDILAVGLVGGTAAYLVDRASQGRPA
ncbi:AzlC family ABC transporter permease [Enterovirga sp.]|jgi:predicted branched-subunit amino acid permease|uniref:AzlC family ABC transporter permease n=1 Tax=Enterovirga sp. TaxID=2026350 RepID=UPI00261D799F|nr:AzlC family ABC transporter permease [Enterovirga sp.]MDB5592519.1 azlC family protein [Enterovirga sp.]